MPRYRSMGPGARPLFLGLALGVLGGCGISTRIGAGPTTDFSNGIGGQLKVSGSLGVTGSGESVTGSTVMHGVGWQPDPESALYRLSGGLETLQVPDRGDAGFAYRLAGQVGGQFLFADNTPDYVTLGGTIAMVGIYDYDIGEVVDDYSGIGAEVELAAMLPPGEGEERALGYFGLTADWITIHPGDWLR